MPTMITPGCNIQKSNCVDLYSKGRIPPSPGSSQFYGVGLQQFGRNTSDITNVYTNPIIIDDEFQPEINLYTFRTDFDAILKSISLLVQVVPINPPFTVSGKLNLLLYVSPACSNTWNVISSFYQTVDIPPLPDSTGIVVPIYAKLPQNLIIHKCDRLVLVYNIILDRDIREILGYNVTISGQVCFSYDINSVKPCGC